ncbi:MAG TPA: hypothetical protein PKY27_10125 [Arachnia sp.]|jgi:hypothetical protein|nr:hypothetical protein [Propionibacteriaceae bacterium]HQD22598.1 hypothetical protein [Arachnia sp.]
MSRTTIAIQTDTRSRIKAGAARQAETVDGFLRLLLDEHERGQFWATFAEVTPEEYAAAMSADGDDLDQDYRIEDAASEVENP